MISMRLKTFGIAAALVAGVSSAAMAQYPCPPGYGLYTGVCQPIAPPSYANPVSGAVAGEAAGAAAGYATGGPIGAVIDGAIGTATGTLVGAANVLSPRACAPGYIYYSGACYPAVR